MQLFAIPYSVSQAFARATHTSPRLYFFIFALLQCLIQVVLRASVLAMDVQAVAITDLLLARLPAADAGSRSHVPVMQDGALLGCDRPPLQTGVVCAVVSHAPAGPMPAAVHAFGIQAEVTLPPTYTAQCQHSMILPNTVFMDGEKEDSTLLLFQVFLLALGMSGLFQDSIPHMAAALGGQAMNTAWSAFRISSLISWRDIHIKYVVWGACSGVDVLQDTWGTRITFSSIILCSNAIMLVITAYLSINLIMGFMRATYDRVGATAVIARAHKWALAFSMSLNGGFLLLASVVLWLIKISTLPLAHVVPHCGLYQAAAGVTLLAIPAWMLMGWRSICLECFWRFITFCALGALILATWIAMFATSVYSYIFHTWPFFATISVVSVLLLLGAAALGAVCRFHFGRGLAHFLEVQAILARDNFARATFTYSDEHAFAGGERGAPDNVFLAAELGLAKKPLPFGAAFGTSARSSMLSFSSGPEKAGLPRPAGGFAGADAGAGGLQPPPRAAFNPKRASAGSASSGGSASVAPARPRLGLPSNPAATRLSASSAGTFGRRAKPAEPEKKSDRSFLDL